MEFNEERLEKGSSQKWLLPFFILLLFIFFVLIIAKIILLLNHLSHFLLNFLNFLTYLHKNFDLPYIVGFYGMAFCNRDDYMAYMVSVDKKN